MYIYSPIESVNEQSVYLLNPVKNRILKNSYFIKVSLRDFPNTQKFVLRNFR